MAEQPQGTKSQSTKSQEEFANAGNANVMQQAGEGLGSTLAPPPTPGERLTTSEVHAEAGRPGQDLAREENVRASDPGGVRPRGLEQEALREQHLGDGAGDTDTEDERGDQVRARVEGLIGNPD